MMQRKRVEEWRAIPSCPCYEVSNYGRARSLPRVACDGKRLQGKMLKPATTRTGHKRVGIWINGRGRTRYLHGLVLEAFVGPRPEGMQCRHLNGVAGDNVPENLAWGTHLENMRDKADHGTHNRGERHNLAKLSELQVQAMRALLSRGARGVILARLFRVSQATVSMVRHGKVWPHLRWPEGTSGPFSMWRRRHA